MATPRAARSPASGSTSSRRDGEGTEVRGPGGRRLPRGEGAGRRRARGEGRVRRGDSRATRRAGNGTLPLAQGDDGRQWRGTREEGRARGQGVRRPARRRRGVAGHAARGEDAAREGAAGAGRPPGGPGMARKDPGADPELPANAERAAMATAPGDKHGLCEILPAVGTDRGGHGYARNAQPGGETGEHAAARKAVAGHPGPVAAPTATGAPRRGPTQAASREGASAGGPPTASWERRAWSRGRRGEDGATAPMGARSPGRPLTCFAASGGGTTSGPTPPTRSG